MHNKCQIFSEKMKTERGDAGSSVGVCVTGEARAFALHGVRASLRSFLAALGRHTLVRMIVARASSASCSGHIFHASGKMCYLARHSVFRMEHQQLQAEFPGAHITLLNASSCALEPASAQPCCRLHLAEASYGLNLTTPRPEPGAFLQYWTVARCAAELLAMAERQGRSLRFIVRTRPDNVYLRPSETASLIYSARDAARTRVACKFSTCKAATDIFMVTPVQRASAFFGAIPSLMNANCAPALAGAAAPALLPLLRHRRWARQAHHRSRRRLRRSLRRQPQPARPTRWQAYILPAVAPPRRYSNRGKSAISGWCRSK